MDEKIEELENYYTHIIPVNEKNYIMPSKVGYENLKDNYESVELDKAPERDVNDWEASEIPNYWSQYQFANELIKPNDFNENVFTKIRTSVTKKIRKNIEKYSMCPDRYNIPRDIKTINYSVPMKDLVILTKPLREYIGFLNFRFVPKEERKFTYPRLIPQEWLFIADSRIISSNNSDNEISPLSDSDQDDEQDRNYISQGLFVHFPSNFKSDKTQRNRYIEAGSCICPYYGVYLTNEEYKKIYGESNDESATYVYSDDVYIDYNDGVNELHNVFYERIFIDGGKYGSLATRSNHACDDCCNCIIKKYYIPISMDTYRVTWYLVAVKNIHDYEEITWNYGNSYNMKCNGPVGHGCPNYTLDTEDSRIQESNTDDIDANANYLRRKDSNILTKPNHIYNISDVPIHDIRFVVPNPIDPYSIEEDNVFKNNEFVRMFNDYAIGDDAKKNKLTALYPYLHAPLDTENDNKKIYTENKNIPEQLIGIPEVDPIEAYKIKFDSDNYMQEKDSKLTTSPYYIHGSDVDINDLPFVAHNSPINFIANPPHTESTPRGRASSIDSAINSDNIDSDLDYDESIDEINRRLRKGRKRRRKNK